MFGWLMSPRTITSEMGTQSDPGVSRCEMGTQTFQDVPVGLQMVKKVPVSLPMVKKVSKIESVGDWSHALALAVLFLVVNYPLIVFLLFVMVVLCIIGVDLHTKR